jgi:hypothetical protein
VAVALPSVNLSGAAGVFKGKSYALTINPATDLGGTPIQYSISWGDGTSNVYTSTGSAIAATHTYSSVLHASIRADLVDNTGTFTGAGSLAVNVAAPPTLTLTGASTVGVTRPYSLTVGAATDGLGTVTSYIVHWGDSTTTTTATPTTLTHTYTTTGAKSIAVDVVDATGTYASAATLGVTVNNLPTIPVTGNSFANATGIYTVTLGTATDANGTPSQYIIHWGDGTTNTQTATGAYTHTYAAAQAATISVDLVDAKGTTTSAGSLAVTVDPTPTMVVTGNAFANSTGLYTLNLGALTDPGYTPSRYVVEWGDGTATTYGAAGAVTHVFTTIGTAKASVDLIDPTGHYLSVGSTSVKIDAKPTVTLTGSATGTVGSSYSLTIAGFNDQGYTPSQYTINWGDGTTSVYSTTGVVKHTYTKGITTKITADLIDSTGTYLAAGTLAVSTGSGSPALATPSVTLSGSTNANVGGIYVLSMALVSDTNGPPIEYIVNWGDGQASVYSAASAATHIYAATGSDTISVDVMDPAGTFHGVATHAVTVDAAPKVTLGGSATSTTNAVYTLGIGTPSDPGYTVSQYTIHWGDGTVQAVAGTSSLVTHTYTKAATNAITIDITDPTGTYLKVGSASVVVSSTTTAAVVSTNADIGSPAIAGSGTFANGLYTISGEGSAIGGTTDQFHFDSKSTTGNVTAIVEVTSLTNTNALAKAGLMIRNGTAANAAFADIVVTPGGTLLFQWRTTAGGTASQTTLTGHTAPQWVKLVRSGNSFSAYYSSNGTTWTQLGSTQTIVMASAVNTGLVVTSLNTTTKATGTFANLSIA